MQSAQFPASAASSLIAGYGDDFASFATTLAQTLAEISARGIEIDESRATLVDLERRMCELVADIHSLLAGTPLSEPSTASVNALDAAANEVPAPGVATSPSEPALESRVAQPQPSANPPAAITGCPPRLLLRPENAPSNESLKGNNQSMPLLSVCQFLGRMRKSGIMHVSILEEELTFEFTNGCVQHTTSTECPGNERIGAVLVSMGLCDDSDLVPLLSAAKSDEPLGDAILQSGLVSHGQLLEALEYQVQLRFERACKTVLASYRFEEGTCPPTDGRILITPLELAWSQKHDGTPG